MTLAERNAISAFDMGLVQRGARNRRTPYYEATQRYGPKGFTVYNHMYFPIRFDTFEAEFDALLNDVTIWDVSVERCLEISGPDGFRFAQLLTPRDLSKCAVGQAKYVLICDSRRRDRQRPGPDPDGREHVLVRPRVVRRAALRPRPPERLPGPRRDDPRGRRRTAPGPGPEVEGPHPRPRRRLDPRPQVLLVAARRDPRHPGRHHPDRLDVRGRLRDLPARQLARAPSCGRRSWRSARRTTSGRPARATSAGSRARSSTGAPT